MYVKTVCRAEGGNTWSLGEGGRVVKCKAEGGNTWSLGGVR